MSARFRRTDQQITVDKQRIEAGLSEVQWQRLAHAGLAWILSMPLTAQDDLDKLYQSEVEPDATPDHPIKQSIKAAISSAIEYTPVTQSEADHAPIGAGLSHADVVNLATLTTNSIIGTVVEQFEARLNTVAASLRPSQVIAGIKINDKPVVAMPSGAHPLLPEIIRKSAALRLIDQSVMLVGPAGSGKTLIGKQYATALNLPLTIIPLSQGVSEAHLHGRFTPNGWHPGVFADAFTKPGVIVLDEFDAGDRNAILSLNAPLSGPGYTNPLNGVWTERHPECWILATANTMGCGGDAIYSARERLDGSTRDRFLLEPVGYLETVEDALLSNAKLKSDLRELRKLIEANGSGEFVGYRAFQRAQVFTDAGYSRDQILIMIIYPFAADLKDAVISKLKIAA